MSTYLTLCQQMAREVRIPGSGPTTVTGNTGELEKICRYIRDADLDIKRRWIDWNFLWAEFSSTTTADSFSLSSSGPSNLAAWDKTSFVYDPTSDDYIPLTYVDYDRYRKLVLGTQVADKPTMFTVKPDKSIALYPKADASATVTAEYWKKGITLTTDSDESEIPEYHQRIIIVRAKIYYAEAEDAPEIMAASIAEHEDLLRTLEAMEHRDQENHVMARAGINPPVIVE